MIYKERVFLFVCFCAYACVLRKYSKWEDKLSYKILRLRPFNRQPKLNGNIMAFDKSQKADYPISATQNLILVWPERTNNPISSEWASVLKTKDKM